MTLRCILDHDYGELKREKEREESGEEIVITVREYRECSRCGHREVVSEHNRSTDDLSHIKHMLYNTGIEEKSLFRSSLHAFDELSPKQTKICQDVLEGIYEIDDSLLSLETGSTRNMSERDIDELEIDIRRIISDLKHLRAEISGDSFSSDIKDSINNEIMYLNERLEDIAAIKGRTEDEDLTESTSSTRDSEGGEQHDPLRSVVPPSDKIHSVPDTSLEYDDLTDREPIDENNESNVAKAVLSITGSERIFAIKEPRVSGTIHPEEQERILKEAKIWDKIDDHDHIVGVVDYGKEPIPWIAMEYLDGGHLGQRGSNMDTPQALWTALAVTSAVRHAHKNRIAHLDLKPQNILFQILKDAWDVPKVADWGLSKDLLDHSPSVEGLTPKYAAPEEFTDEYGPVDRTTDIYQLGVVFYELFTGQPPFKSHNVRHQVLNQSPTPPSEISDIPEVLDEIILTALAKEKDDRYDDILYLRDDLRNVLEHQVTSERKPPDRHSTRTKYQSTQVQEITQDDAETPASTESTGESHHLTPQYPMFQGNPARTGHQSNGSGPQQSITEQWTFQTDGAMKTSPAVVDGTVYVASSDENLYAVNAEGGTEQWAFQTGVSTFSSPAVVDDTVYVGSNTNIVYAIDAAEGTEQWAFETGDHVFSSPAVADGTVYIGSSDGNVYAIDAADGTEQWAFQTGKLVHSSPAVVDGTVYVGSADSNVYAIDAEDGTGQWAFQTGDSVFTSPAVVDGTVYVGSKDNHVYAIDAKDCTEQWIFKTDDDVSTSPAVAHGTVYVGSKDTNLYAIDAAEGTEQWKFQTGGAVRSSPAVADGTVYVGSFDDSIHAIDAADGTEQWRFQTSLGVESSPAVVDGTVYIGSNDLEDNVYALIESRSVDKSNESSVVR